MAHPAAPLRSRPPDQITEDEKNSFKLIKMAYCTIRQVLYTIFTWGTLQGPGQTMEHYLLNTKSYSGAKYRSYFDASQRLKLNDRALEQTYDVTLLFKCIYHACDKLDTDPQSTLWRTPDDTKLEWLVNAAKSFRNQVSHSMLGVTRSELEQEARNLMVLLENSVTVAAALYNQDQSGAAAIIQDMQQDIASIRDQSLTPLDISQYQGVVLNEKLKEILKEKGSQELKEVYQVFTQLNPIAFLEGRTVLLNVSSVFTQIEVENAGEKAKGSLVPYEDILPFCRNNATLESSTTGKRPDVYLIEGPAGAGKTTLLKLIKSHWSGMAASGSVLMKGLQDFDLVLFMECRNSTLSSFSQLLNHLMPNTNAKYYHDDQLMKFTMSLSILLVVDGIDEVNASSEKLLREVFSLKMDSLVLLCTTRPEKVSYFMAQVPSQCPLAHLRILGIAKNKREEFIRMYHDELVRLGISQQDTEALVQFLKMSAIHLQVHYRLPLNLVVLVWVWADNPSRLTALTTATELYLETHSLMKKKLVERLLHNHPTSHADLHVLKDRVEVFLGTLYRESLLTLSQDRLDRFPAEAVTQMKAVCDGNDLPQKETMSAFLVIKNVGQEEHVSVPHKLMHEFYAAMWVKQQLLGEGQRREDKAALDNLTKLLRDNQMGFMTQQLAEMLRNPQQPSATQQEGALRSLLADLHPSTEPPTMTRYQGLLLQVAGLLYSQEEQQVEQCTGRELVQLLHEAELGCHNSNEWFTLSEITKENPLILERAACHVQGELKVLTKRVGAALALLENGARPSKVVVDVTNRSQELPALPPLLTKIAKCGCEADLYLHREFQDPQHQPENDSELQTVAATCKVGEVLCHVSGGALSCLPASTSFLHLALTPADPTLLPQLAALHSHQPLIGLGLHVTVGVVPEALQTLPEIDLIYLVLSEVDEAGLSRAVRIAAALLPPDSMYIHIRFPKARVSAQGWRSLLQDLVQSGTGVGHLVVPEDTPLTLEEYHELEELFYTDLRCKFCKQDEETMWETTFNNSSST